MGGTPLLAEPFLDDDDEDVRRVQRFAGAGARTGAKLGAIGGPVGAGVGAGFGSAAGYLLGYGLTGADPQARRESDSAEGTHAPEDTDNHDDADDGVASSAAGHADDGPITIDVTEETG